MGRPGELKRPSLPPGPLKDLNDALHDLHLQAGLPTLGEIARSVANGWISRSSLHAALTGTTLPRRDTVDALVEILASRSRKTTPEQELDRFDSLWQQAAQARARTSASELLPESTAELLVLHLVSNPHLTPEVLDLLRGARAASASDYQSLIDLVVFLEGRDLLRPSDFEQLIDDLLRRLMERPRTWPLASQSSPYQFDEAAGSGRWSGSSRILRNAGTNHEHSVRRETARQTRIGVTGHPDLTWNTLRLVASAFRRHLLASLREGDRKAPGLVGVSCLARGADSVFAEMLIELGGQLEVILPSSDYRMSQIPPDYAPLFDSLIQSAASVQVMPWAKAGPQASIAANNAMLDKVDALVAVWDGTHDPDGDTGYVVQEARTRQIPVTVIWPKGSRRT